MKKKPPAKGRKTGLVGQAKSAFTKAVILGSLGLGVVAVGKNWLDRARAPVDEAPTLTETFRCTVENEALLAKIDRTIKRLEANDTQSTDFVLMAIDMGRFVAQRGYGAGQHLALNQDYQLAYNISWDLSVLGLYHGEATKTFTAETQTALSEFQKLQNIEITGQPGAKTLRALGEQAYHQRMLVGLHAWKVSLKRNVPVIDLLAIIGSESSGNRFAKASTSSALGLSQFTNETTVFVFAKDGHKLADPCNPDSVKAYESLQRDARAIMKLQADKKPLTPNLQKSYERMLAMRTNFETSIDMTALYGIRMNGKFSAGKHYVFHFAGAAGGRLLLDNPDKPAAELLPAAAAANMTLFYEKIELKKDRKKRVVIDRKTKKPVRIGVNPLTADALVKKLAAKVMSPARLSEARTTDVIMRNVISLMDETGLAEAKTLSTAGNNASIQVK